MENMEDIIVKIESYSGEIEVQVHIGWIYDRFWFIFIQILNMATKVKCYGLFEGDKQILLIYSNPSQKDFLDYQLKSCLKRLKKGPRIEFENTANGVWYIRQNPHNPQQTQLTLLSKQYSSISAASSILTKTGELHQQLPQQKDKQKLKMKIDDLIKLLNANTKVDSLSNSILELQDIMKGNVNKIVNNMSDLDTAERKSFAMAEMSMQFERDSRKLEEKMKKRKCMMKLAIAVCVTVAGGIVAYLLFM